MRSSCSSLEEISATSQSGAYSVSKITGKQERRGTETTVASSSNATAPSPSQPALLAQQQQQQEQEGKPHRRVSFTTATTFVENENANDPPSVVVVDDLTTEGCSFNTTVTNNDTTEQAALLEEDPCQSPRPLRRNSLDVANLSLEATPHHSNATDTCNITNDGGASTCNKDNQHHQQQYFHHSFPSPSAAASLFRSPRRAPSSLTTSSRRRSSLDSASSFSSAASTNVSSTGSYISQFTSQSLLFKDNTAQRQKVLESLQWLRRHLADSVVLELIQHIVQQNAHSNDDNDDNHQRGSNTTATTTMGRSFHRSSTFGSSSSNGGGRQHQVYRRKSSGSSKGGKKHKHPSITRRSSSFFQCETADDLMSSNNSHIDSQDEVGIDVSEKRRQQRLEKTQESLGRLSTTHGETSSEQDARYVLGGGFDESASSVSSSWNEDEEDNSMFLDQNNVFRPLGASRAEESAILMVDISGFTQLSTTLPLQALSKTINTYFQCLVQCVHDYGGDVVKFAGDAIFAQWIAADDDGDSDKVAKERDGQRHSLRSAVETAAACACQIIDTCSDYHVFKDHHHEEVEEEGSGINIDNKMSSEDEILATLNVHCGIGCGKVLGFHAGDDTRREYLLLGDAIPQAGEAIAFGSSGEVVASPQVYQLLTSSASFSDTAEKEELEQPQVIFSSRRDQFVKTPNLLDPTMLRRPPSESSSMNTRPCLCTLLKDWDYQSLVKLQQRMLLYVHPAVLDGEVFTDVYHNRGASSFDDCDGSQSGLSSSYHDQQIQQSEAEIRQVFTVFLQPLIDVKFEMEEPEKVEGTLAVLNQIMVLANRELNRFKGHLRQFILDDKGVVLIANFGLRGSVYPKMIEEHAMPFAASLQSALRAELDVESRIGATFGGKAYCGIVGGFERHEYSVLGPSVNLAARLMGNPQNQGFLVDEAVRQEAESWEFKPLALVVAKGYAEPVPIFEPLVHNRSPWKRANGIIVGREEELEVIGNFAGEFIDSGCTESKIVLISAATGFGKSSLMAESVSRIRQKCIAASHSHLILGQVCCEEDLFHPLSVFGPIFLDSLSRMKNRLVTPKKDDYDSDGSKKRSVEASSRINETAMAKEQFYAACECAEIPKEHIKTIYSLVFHHEWPSNSDSESDTDNDSQNQHYPCWSDVPSLLLSEEIPKSIVSMFLQATVDFDIVILGVDDLSLMDEVSWKVLQLLFEHACNVMIIGTARPTTCKAISIDPRFWNYLFAEAVYIGRFMHIDLLPLRESDVRRLIIHYLEESEEEAGSSRDEKKPCSEIVGEQFSHENYLQSGGNPRLVAGMIKNYESIALEGNQSLCANADAEIYEKVKEKSSKRISAVDINISEHVLHRLDSLPAIVRTHLNVGALVGFCFSAKDVISVMEEYRGVPDDGKQEHAEFVNDSLSEAVWHGILEVDEELVTTGKEDDLIQNSKYRFAHKLWQEHIIDLTLDDWQKDMQQLISSTRAT